MISPETRSIIEEIVRRAGHLWRYLDVDSKKTRIADLEKEMADPAFWDDPNNSQKVIAEANTLKVSIKELVAYQERVDDMTAMQELIAEVDEDEAELYASELEETANALYSEIDRIEIASFLDGQLDKNNAILSINAGAGGTESCDWADMLLRMYSRWAERQGYEVEILDLVPGEEAGISKATLAIKGANAYGYARAERGVHRLVRISPFDSNKRRHTSFCAVDVIAEVDDDIDIEIRTEDLRIDTYRASGKGGQHVNKTESAIRLTHIPSGLVVACQNERSQHKNKATAMKMLKSRLYEKIEDEKRSEMEKFYGDKGEIGWGNQIRSYVFQPYQMVKDLRIGVENGNVQAVMDGDLDSFIHNWLRAGKPMTRNKEIQMEDA
ncbi:MAG: peptide chain release factor 2 [Opitutales bacterium]